MREVSFGKRLLSMLLALVLILGLLPANILPSNIFAAEETFEPGKAIDAAAFYSDLHIKSTTSGGMVEKGTLLKNVLTAMKNGTGMTYSSVTSCGDAFAVNADNTWESGQSKFDGDTATLNTYITGVMGSDVDINYVWSDHDRYAVVNGSYLDCLSGLVYGGDNTNYYIYELSHADTSTDPRYSCPSHLDADDYISARKDVTQASNEFKEAVESMDKTKPLFIAAHQPLLDRRDDNGHAYKWAEAINEVAETMDVIYLFGHNHKRDELSDYYYAKGSTMSVCCDSSGNAKNVKLNFTHLCAGYMAPVSSNEKTRQGTALNVVIYENGIGCTIYNSNGVLDSSTEEFNLDIIVEREHEAPAQPTENTLTEWDETNQVSVQVTALGLTGLTVTNAYGDTDLSNYLSDYMSVKVELQGVAEGTEIKYSMLVHDDIGTDGLVLYHVGENGKMTRLDYTLSTSASGGSYLNFTTPLTGTFAYGLMSVPEGYTLSGISVSNVVRTNYFVGESLDMVNPIVTATYTKAGAEDFTRVIYIKDDYAVTDGYTISGNDMITAGKRTITITYQNCTTSFDIVLWNRDVVDENISVSVHLGEGEFGVTNLDVEVVPEEQVENSVEGCLKPGTFVAYDISLVFAEGFQGYNTTKVVTLPTPEGVKNPAVFYVDDDGSVERMKSTKNADGTVSFETTHFSTYVVGESTEIEVPNSETATGTGSFTTTEEKEVYVLVSTPTAGNQYIIVSRNTAGSGYALKENTTTGSSITVNAAENGISAPWIETTDETIMWNATSGLKFQSENGGYYLRYSSGLSFSTSNSTNWTYSNNQLYYNYYNYRQYYLRYNSGWSASTTSSNVYLYEKQTVEVETTTKAEGTYSIAGEPSEVTMVVKNGSTLDLGATLTFKPTSGAATTTDITASATFSIVENGDPNGVISGSISGNTVTFTGETGRALVKVSYTTSFGVVTNYIVIIAQEPTYTVTIKDGNKVVSGTTVSIKNVSSTTTLQLTPVGSYDEGNGPVAVDNATWEWTIPAEYQNIATVDATGKVSFKGVDGAFYVTATLVVDGKEVKSAGVNISCHTGSYSTPTDGALDFPEYPNPGSVNFDKTATAVGNFSETGMVQMELSMSGIPYGNQALDIVVLLDNSSSMDDVSSRLPDTRAATMAFLETLLKNSDGTWNNHNILVADYYGGKMTNDNDPYGANVYTVNDKWNFTYTATNYHSGGTTDSIVTGGFQNINSDEELAAIQNKLNTTYTVTSNHPSGTDYDHALLYAQAALKTARDAGSKNKQFVVMMTDGVPTNLRYEGTKPTYTYANNAKGNTAQVSTDPLRYILYSSTPNNDSYAMFLKKENGNIANTQSLYDFTTRGPNYRYEVVSDDLKKEGVTIYTVGVGLFNVNGAWNNGTYHATANECGNGASIILNDIAGPAGETTKDTGNTLSKKDKYFFELKDGDTTGLTDAFKNIAVKIADAATDIVVTDKITDTYTMVFGIPTGSELIDPDKLPADQEFYIEVVNYALDANHDRTGDVENLIRVYLKDSNGTAVGGTYSAADKDGNALGTPQFTAKAGDEKAYWSVVEAGTVAQGDDIIINVNGTYYKFQIKGDGTHNMTSGAHAFGNIDADTNMSDDLVIVTPYFAYCAKTRMLAWTVEKVVDTSEIALRYFLYLERSATEIGHEDETDPGAYPTNEWAYMYYTNHLGHECRNEFPKPQITWSGAQVSYVFYLVNAAGQPINKSGQVVDFANATFITDVYTESVIWNRGQDGTILGNDKLSVSWLAEKLLPTDYKVYDTKASFDLNVYASHTGDHIFDYFVLNGGTASEISASLNSRLNLKTTTASVITTKVYNTKAGERIDTYGTYTSGEATNMEGEIIKNDFDFYGATVAFAVVWQPKLVEDTVVVDFGLDVLIDVTRNDTLLNAISGINGSKTSYGSITMGTGINTGNAKFDTKPLSIDGNTITIENENQIRFHQGDMIFNQPVKFYYESPVEFYENSDKMTGYMYTSVTVIPATSIYYEDSFLNLTSFSNDGSGFKEDEGKNGKWVTAGTTVDGVQDQDRPGETQISALLDADNKYGYDSAYETMSKFSLGSAAKITVDANTRGEATFTFKGTGFDVISVTSNATGVLLLEVKNAAGEIVKSTVIDTFYGMDHEGNTVDTSSDNALYQIPVIKIYDLPYGEYTVRLIAGYNQYFDHNDPKTDGSYDLYLDAVRIYDPTGNQNDDANAAYVKDGEGWPEYETLRDNVIKAAGVTVTKDEDGKVIDVTIPDDAELNGPVFIDCNDGTPSVADYISHGPNNELYLANNQAVAFNVNLPANVADVQLGIKIANGTTVTYKINGDSYTVSTATDLYYSVLKYAKAGTVVIENVSGGILSITNIKVTHTEATTAGEGLLSINSEGVKFALMSLRRAPALEEPTPEETTPEETTPEETTPEETTPEETTPEETTPEETTPEETTPEETTPEDDNTSEGTDPDEGSGWFGKVIGAIGGFIRKLFGWIFN